MRLLTGVPAIIRAVAFGVMLLVWGILANAQLVPGVDSENAAGAQPSSALLQSSVAQNDSASGTHSGNARGTILGTILDPTGAVTVGAKVRLTSKAQPLNLQEVSGGNGQFTFSQVPPGAFQLSITAPGFASQTFSGELQAGQTFLVPAIVLPVAAAETEVRVGVSDVEVAEAQIKQQEKQRVIGFIPNFYVTYEHDAAPLNARQKFELAWKTAADPITLLGTGVYAGLEQAGDRYPEYGQGVQGYAKRYGQAYADAVSGIFIGNAILPSLLKQDPRYFYKGTGSTRSRLLYAIASSVMCKGDNKRWQPNYSFMLGSIAVGGISNLYVPARERDGVGLVFQNALIRIGQGSLGGILQEFVLRKLTGHPHHQSDSLQ